MLLWASVQPCLTHTHRPDAAACWSWADFWPVPPRSLSHSCKETSWQGATTHDLITHGIIMVFYLDLRVDCSYTNHLQYISLVCVCVCVLTIPSEWSASCRRWCRAHTPCRAPTGLCLCSRCWRTGSCGTGCPDRPSEPVYWTDSGVRGHNPTGTVTRWRHDPLLPRPDCCFVSAHHYTKNKYSVCFIEWAKWSFSPCSRLSFKKMVIRIFLITKRKIFCHREISFLKLQNYFVNTWKVSHFMISTVILT